MTIHPCGCDTDELLPCETHMDILVSREGASLRTADELGVQFIHDCLANFMPELLDHVHGERGEFDRISAALEDARDPHSGCAWLENDDDREALHDLERLVEARLPEGIQVLWQDGYLIYQITGDSPLVEQDA